MPRIIVFGNAKQTTILDQLIPSDDLTTPALNWLRSQGIPIASSCNGEGVCKKCIINTNLISCQLTLKDLLNDNTDEIKINVSYL
jgi:Na+-transporting NADH:ubiquinone oxidoreductase subunit NqrF